MNGVCMDKYLRYKTVRNFVAAGLLVAMMFCITILALLYFRVML